MEANELYSIIKTSGKLCQDDKGIVYYDGYCESCQNAKLKVPLSEEPIKFSSSYSKILISQDARFCKLCKERSLKKEQEAKERSEKKQKLLKQKEALEAEISALKEE